MREDRLFRQHFRHQTEQQPVPANPWRQRATRNSRAWQDERQPSRFSIVVYALAGLSLATCLGVQAGGWYHSQVVQGAQWLLSDESVRAQVVAFVTRLPQVFN